MARSQRAPDLVSATATRWGSGVADVLVGLGGGYWRFRDEANPHRESGLALRAPSQ